jgi:hypothetical protein
MAEGTLTEPTYVARLNAALQERLPGAEVTHEQIRRDRYRFEIISDEFNDLGHPECQRIVWDVADATLSKGELLNIGMILTIAPADYPDTNLV